MGAARQLLQAELGDDAVLAHQRHDVGEGTDGGDLHERRQPALLARLLAQPLDDLEGDADAGEVLVGIAAVGALGIDDRERLRQFGVGLVVIRDDEVDTELDGAPGCLGSANAAVDRHDHPGALGVQPIDGGRLQAVAVAQSLGNEMRDIGAEQFQRPAQDDRRGHAVDVVVAMHDDAFAAGGRRQQTVDGGRQVGHQPRIEKVRQRRAEEAVGQFRVVMPTDGQQARHDRRQAQFSSPGVMQPPRRRAALSRPVVGPRRATTR